MHVSIVLENSAVLDRVEGIVIVKVKKPTPLSLVTILCVRRERVKVNKMIMAKASHVELDHTYREEVFPAINLACGLMAYPGEHHFSFTVPVSAGCVPSVGGRHALAFWMESDDFHFEVRYELRAEVSLRSLVRRSKSTTMPFTVMTARMQRSCVPASLTASHGKHATSLVRLSNTSIIVGEDILVDVFVRLSSWVRPDAVVGVTITLFNTVTILQKGEWACGFQEAVETQFFAPSRGHVDGLGECMTFPLQYRVPSFLHPQCSVDISLKNLPRRGLSKGPNCAGGAATRIVNTATTSYKLQVAVDICRAWAGFDGHLTTDFPLEVACVDAEDGRGLFRGPLPVQRQHQYLPAGTSAFETTISPTTSCCTVS
eukprot:PhM_4_TR7767/c0_g1_i1/m.46027